jgi:hypothetical protein
MRRHRPRTVADRAGRSLADFHRACLRMLAAEYAGDGRLQMHDGMPIESFDCSGVNDAEN